MHCDAKPVSINPFGKQPVLILDSIKSLSSFGVFDHISKNWRREFPINSGKSIHLVENPNDATEGGEFFIWPASLVLSNFLVRSPSTVSGLRVAELGSSHGLASLVAISLGASFVAATDREHVMQFLKSNIEMNPSFDVTPVVLEWGSSISTETMNTLQPPLDVIIGSDLSFCRSSFSALIETILLLSDLHTRIYLVHDDESVPSGHKLRAEFFSGMASKHFEITELDADSIDAAYRDPRIRIFSLRRLQAPECTTSQRDHTSKHHNEPSIAAAPNSAAPEAVQAHPSPTAAATMDPAADTPSNQAPPHPSAAAWHASPPPPVHQPPANNARSNPLAPARGPHSPAQAATAEDLYRSGGGGGDGDGPGDNTSSDDEGWEEIVDIEQLRAAAAATRAHQSALFSACPSTASGGGGFGAGADTGASPPLRLSGATAAPAAECGKPAAAAQAPAAPPPALAAAGMPPGAAAEPGAAASPAHVPAAAGGGGLVMRAAAAAAPSSRSAAAGGAEAEGGVPFDLEALD